VLLFGESRQESERQSTWRDKRQIDAQSHDNISTDAIK